MRTETRSKLTVLATLLLLGAWIAEAQTRSGSASATRSSGGSGAVSGSGSSKSSPSRSSGGTAYRRPAGRAPGSASVTRSGSTGSVVRPGTPIYRPPSAGRPPGNRPPGHGSYYPSHGYRPYWSWRFWGWPYYGHFYPGFWGWPYYTSYGSWTTGYWGPPYGAPGSYREPYRVRFEEPDRGGLQLRIKPKSAEVWIDGSYAGKARDFDGFPSYLWLAGGSHQISFYNPGYQTETRGFEVLPGRVGEVRLKLDRGQSTPPPGPPTPPAPVGEEAPPASAGQAPGAEGARSGPSARVELEVLPGEAAVFLDGRYLGTGNELSRLHSAMLVEAGPHQLEVTLRGYRTERRALTLEPGEERALVIRLDG